MKANTLANVAMTFARYTKAAIALSAKRSSRAVGNSAVAFVCSSWQIGG